MEENRKTDQVAGRSNKVAGGGLKVLVAFIMLLTAVREKGRSHTRLLLILHIEKDDRKELLTG